jgi:hypothetical protein
MILQIGETTSDFLMMSAGALTSRRSPPPTDPVETAIAAYTSEIAAIRGRGLMQSLPSSELEPVFALGFALQQVQHDLADLSSCVLEWTGS